MKPRFSLIAEVALFVICGLALMSASRGQQLTILHSFGDGSVTNDGSLSGYAYASISTLPALVQGTNGNFYGTTFSGGTSNFGTVFEISPSGTLTILYSFSGRSDGGNPATKLVQGTDGNFYGTTYDEGSSGSGTIYKLTPRGNLTVLHTFGDGSVANDGLIPLAGLIQGSDGNFYGTTSQGGSGSAGIIFKITPDGAYTVLHNFGDGTVVGDGGSPDGELIQGADGNFYGTANTGGSNNRNDSIYGGGTVFKMTPQGTLTVLHTFDDGSLPNDGLYPEGALVQGKDGNFYGTTAEDHSGNSYPEGAIFEMTPQGAVTILHIFSDDTVAHDGAHPEAGLILGPDGNFYGTTIEGGSTANPNANNQGYGTNPDGSGTIFRLTPQGVLTLIHNFGDGTVPNDGLACAEALVRGANGLLYGITPAGGSAGGGVVFSLAPDAIVLTSPATASGSVTVPFSYQVGATQGPTAYAAANLPDGLSIDGVKGIISGTPTTVGTSVVTLTVTTPSGSANLTLTITIGPVPAPVITSALTAYGSVGAPFTYTTTAANNATSYSATGLTGTGLAIDPTTGIISGTPLSVGTLAVTVTATNATGDSTPANLSIQILSAPPTLSQEYNILHRFNDGSVTNDGIYPEGIIQAFDGNFYGVTSGHVLGGSINNPSGTTGPNGAIFKLTPQGTESVFYTFVGLSGLLSPTSLIQGADGNFYGTTGRQIFKLTLQGQLTILHSFNDPQPNLTGLVQGFDGNFYGGGQSEETGVGTAFKITPQGAFTTLHTFGDGSVANDANAANTLIQGTDGNFYGTSTGGGSAGYGTVFKMTPQGAVTILYSFTGYGDGSKPTTALVQGSDDNFYGTTYNGGPGGPTGFGTVFQITPQGSLTTLHSFGDGSVANDGANPAAPLIQGDDGNFYGSTYYGGAGYGTVFEITPQGTLTILHTFGDGSVPNDGTGPASALVQGTNGNFYGVTYKIGNDYGTIYSFDAMQTPVHVPIFFGAAYGAGAINSPFSFTPKAAFGVSGSGAETGNLVQAQSSGGGIMEALVSVLPQWLRPQTIRPAFSATNWTLMGGPLPNYLIFDSTSGTVSGTPSQGGTFTVTMTPHNAIGSGTPQTVTFYIDVPPGISSALSLSTLVDTPFSYQIEALPPADSYGATALPGWLSVDPVGGVISGTPPIAGDYVFNAIVDNQAGQAVQPVALTVTSPASSLPVITSATTANGAVGTSFTYQIEASSSPTGFTALGLPAGLLFDAMNGTILGTPSETGTFSVPITATNANGSYASVLSLTIAPASAPDIASSLLATAVEGSPFSYAIPVTGVVSNYSETDPLPAGLAFNNSTGVISGTATVTGTFPIAITVANGTGSSTGTLNLNVAAPATFSQWETAHNNFTGAPIDTSFGDGVPNLLKYLYDIDPTVPISAADRAALPSVGIDTTTNPGTKYFTLTYRQYASESGITVNVQTSPDLQTWTTVTPDLSQQIGTDPNTGDSIMEVGVKASGEANQFIRLDVTQP